MATKTPIPSQIIDTTPNCGTKIDQYSLETNTYGYPYLTHYQHITYTVATRTSNVYALLHIPHMCAWLRACECVCAVWNLINVCFCSFYLERLFWCVTQVVMRMRVCDDACVSMGARTTKS